MVRSVTHIGRLLGSLMVIAAGAGAARAADFDGISYRPRPVPSVPSAPLTATPRIAAPAMPTQLLPLQPAPVSRVVPAPAAFVPTGHDRAYYRAEPMPIIPPAATVVTRPAAPSAALPSRPLDSVAAPPGEATPSARRRARLARQTPAEPLPQGTEGRQPPAAPGQTGGGHVFPGRHFDVSARVFHALTRDMCALTFDDGPSSAGDPAILDALQAAGIKGTWFVVGRMVNGNPALLQRIAAGGHEIAVHGWTHHDFRTMDDATRADELARSIAAIHAVAPQATLKLFRPPYGSYNNATLSAAAAAGLTTVMWNVDPKDWRDRDATLIAAAIGAEAAPGGVILMHSTIGASATALPGVIADLSARGCRFYTVSDWLAEAERRITLYKTPTAQLLTPAAPAAPMTQTSPFSVAPTAVTPASVMPTSDSVTPPAPTVAPAANPAGAPADAAKPAAHTGGWQTAG